MHQQLVPSAEARRRYVEKAKWRRGTAARPAEKALLTDFTRRATAVSCSGTLQQRKSTRRRWLWRYGGRGGPELSHSERSTRSSASQSKFVESERAAELQTRSLTAAMDASRAAMDGLASARAAAPIESEER